jgi:serine/threonine protein kinase
MTLLEGGSLREKLENHENGLPEEEVRKYFNQLINAVHYCHEHANIAHRDIKPENLILDENNKLYLCDFGVS